MRYHEIMADKFFVKETEQSDRLAHLDYQVLAEGPDDGGEYTESYSSLEEAQETCNRWNQQYELLQSYLNGISERLEDALAYISLIDSHIFIRPQPDLDVVKHTLIGLQADLRKG
jgi:hypothetical protein